MTNKNLAQFQGSCQIEIYKFYGEKVIELVNQVQEAGSYIVHFNAKALASGVYFYRISAGDFVQTKKLILLK